MTSRITGIQKIGGGPTSLPEMQQLFIRTRSPNDLLTTGLSSPSSSSSVVVDSIVRTDWRRRVAAVVDGTSHQGGHGPLGGQEVVSCEWETGA